MSSRLQAASPEAVVFWCAASYLNSQQADVARRSLTAVGPADWEEVLLLARRQGVLPLVAQSLTGRLVGAVPEEVSAHAHQSFVSVAASGLALASELARLTAHLRKNAIRAIAFKGPALAVQLYGSPCWRESEDLDLLAAPHDWDAAGDALRNSGYRENPNSRASSKHECSFVHAGSGIAVDLHRSLMPAWCGFNLDFDSLFARAEAVSVCGAPVLTLALQDLLLLLSVHAAKHGWSQLKWAADIAQLLDMRRDWDWNAILESAARLRCRRRLLVAIAAACGSFEVPFPEQLKPAMLQDRLAADIAREVQESLVSGWSGNSLLRLHVRVQDDWLGRLRVWRRLLALLARLTEADRPSIFSFLTRPARLLRVHGPALALALRSTLIPSRDR